MTNFARTLPLLLVLCNVRFYQLNYEKLYFVKMQILQKQNEFEVLIKLRTLSQLTSFKAVVMKHISIHLIQILPFYHIPTDAYSTENPPNQLEDVSLKKIKTVQSPFIMSHQSKFPRRKNVATFLMKIYFSPDPAR